MEAFDVLLDAAAACIDAHVAAPPPRVAPDDDVLSRLFAFLFSLPPQTLEKHPPPSRCCGALANCFPDLFFKLLLGHVDALKASKDDANVDALAILARTPFAPPSFARLLALVAAVVVRPPPKYVLFTLAAPIGPAFASFLHAHGTSFRAAAEAKGSEGPPPLLSAEAFTPSFSQLVDFARSSRRKVALWPLAGALALAAPPSVAHVAPKAAGGGGGACFGALVRLLVSGIKSRDLTDVSASVMLDALRCASHLGANSLLFQTLMPNLPVLLDRIFAQKLPDGAADGPEGGRLVRAYAALLRLGEDPFLTSAVDRFASEAPPSPDHVLVFARALALLPPDLPPPSLELLRTRALPQFVRGVGDFLSSRRGVSAERRAAKRRSVVAEIDPTLAAAVAVAVAAHARLFAALVDAEAVVRTIVTLISEFPADVGRSAAEALGGVLEASAGGGLLPLSTAALAALGDAAVDLREAARPADFALARAERRGSTASGGGVVIEESTTRVARVESVLGATLRVLRLCRSLTPRLFGSEATRNAARERVVAIGRVECGALMCLFAWAPEVVALAATILGELPDAIASLPFEAERALGAATVANGAVYIALSVSGRVTTGRAAQQKAVRGLLRRAQVTSGAMKEAWLRTNARWRFYTGVVGGSETVEAEGGGG